MARRIQGHRHHPFIEAVQKRFGTGGLDQFKTQPRLPTQQPPQVQAQPYGRGYDRGYDRGYERRRGYDDGPRYGQRGRFGDYCATSRGACQTRPQPVGSSCRCNIDGLTKRGIIQ